LREGLEAIKMGSEVITSHCISLSSMAWAGSEPSSSRTDNQDIV
jgi:hypothetical protein